MDHLRDPLDYLYEEFSAEDMVEAREHLQSCAECREKIAAVRDTVKAYRRLPRARPPVGLAERTAALALSRVRRGPRPEFLLAPEAEPVAEPVVTEPSPPGWRRWLFHPAWPVAALVMLCCSFLILVSPRARMGGLPALFSDEAGLGDAGSARPASPRRVLRGKPAPLPAATRQKSAMVHAPLPAAPQLAEAEAWEPVEKGEGAERASSPFSAAPATGSVTLRRDSLPVPTGEPPVVLQESTAVAEAPVPAAPALIPALPPVVLYAETGSDGASLETLRRRYPDLDIRPLPEPEPEVKAESHAAPEAPLDESPDAGQGARALAGGDILIDMMPPGPPPRIISRPEPVDSLKAARDLSFLIGLQIGHGEYSDALISISLLRRHDPEKAAELLAILDELLAGHAHADIPIDEAESAPSAQPAEAAEPAREPPAASMEPSKPGPTPEAVEAEPKAIPAEPAAPAILLDPTPDKYYRPEPRAGVDVSKFAAPRFRSPEPGFAAAPPRIPFTTDPYFRGD